MPQFNVLSMLLLLAVMTPDAMAFLGIGERTKMWREDVVLTSGRVMSVDRTITVGPDKFGRTGLKDQVISFWHDGRRIRWTNNDSGPLWQLPDVFEILDGVPTIVMRVNQWGPCYRYDFPPEGLVAFQYHEGNWTRVPMHRISKDLKVNLLRRAYALPDSQYPSDPPHIDVQRKTEIDRAVSLPQQGKTIADAALVYAEMEDSCARMRPPPNPTLEAARRRIMDAELSAPIVLARLAQLTTEPQTVTREMYAEQTGAWFGGGYLSPSCKGIVEKVEVLKQWSGDDKQWSSGTLGYQLVLSAVPGGKVQIHGADRAAMQCVVCDAATIVTLRRRDKDTLIVHRFLHNGELVDAVQVSMPDTAKVVPAPAWGGLWSVQLDARGDLVMTLTDYAYSRLAPDGGTIRRKGTYVVRLPASSAKPAS